MRFPGRVERTPPVCRSALCSRLLSPFGLESVTVFDPGRCLTGVDSISKGLPEFVSIDEEPDHEIVHALRLGEAQRAADEPFNPRPQIDVFALDFLRVLLAHLMLLSIQMPLVGPPAVGVKLRDTKRCQHLVELQEYIVLPSSEHIRQDLPCAVINGVPQP